MAASRSMTGTKQLANRAIGEIGMTPIDGTVDEGY
jgi:hypothetical protein